MAQRKPGIKSQAISEYLSENKDALPRQIVEALMAKGVEVSFGLASKVKYGTKNKKKATAKKSRKAFIRAKGAPAVTGSESIRQFIAKNPAAGPKVIEAGLKSEGIRVSLALISAVKYSKHKKAGKKRRSRSPVVQVAARATRLSAVSVEQLIEVKRFADSFGGADQLRSALDTLDQLR
jgi:hypothetical protein